MKKRVLKALQGVMVLTALVTGLGSHAAFAADSGTVSAPESVAEEPAAAVAAPVYDYDHLTVGTTTPFGGAFFTEMWGNVSSDLDVRELIHGYNLIEWRSEESVFDIDPSVVSGITVTENPDGDRTYLFTIYDNLRYSDGTPVRSADYAFSMLLSIAPQMREIGATTRNAEYLVGYQDYENGTVPYLSGVRILSDTMLSMTVSHEYLPFFYEMALLDCIPYPISEIAPGCVVRDDGQGIYIANEDETVTEPVFTAELLRETILDPEEGYLTHPTVTSGPYHLESFDGTTCELVKNDFYKGNSSGNVPSIGALTYTVVQNDTMVDAFAGGEVGLLNKVVSAQTLSSATGLVGANRDIFSMTNYTRNGLSYFSFCCEQPAVQETEVRKAVAMCLDKEALVSSYVANYGLRADGYYGLGQWMFQLVSGAERFPIEQPEDPEDTEAQAAYEAERAEWEALSLDNAAVYDLDVTGAASLLESAGWTLNADGEPFNPDEDEIRYKEIEGELVGLDLKLLTPEGNSITDYLEEAFTVHLKEAGIGLSVETIPMEELLTYFYCQAPRDCDMIYLATNFDIVFDPSANFRPLADENAADTKNTTHINDEELYNLAVDMRRTEPGDTLSYMKKWIAFEERFEEVLPCIPVYSNVYFDFYPRVLQNYNISSSISWGQAIVNAWMGDPADETESGLSEAEAVLE